MEKTRKSQFVGLQHTMTKCMIYTYVHVYSITCLASTLVSTYASLNPHLVYAMYVNSTDRK